MAIDTTMRGKVALVTGAASGLGRATAFKMAEAGAQIAITDVDTQGLEAVAGQLAEQGADVTAHAFDVTDAAACQAWVHQAAAHFGKINALCNIAGIISLHNAHEMPIEDWNRTLAVNLSAPFFRVQAAIPYLLEQNGAVVNVSSCASYFGEAYAGAYCATKAGITNLTKALAMEYMHKPIRFNCVAPGGMVTNIANNFRPPEGCDFDLLKRYSPLRGCVEVDDVADMVMLLASDAGRGFHGSSIDIDMGVTAG